MAKKIKFILQLNKNILYLQSQMKSGCGEMVDALLWGGSGSCPVRVRVSPSAQKKSSAVAGDFFVAIRLLGNNDIIAI